MELEACVEYHYAEEVNAGWLWWRECTAISMDIKYGSAKDGAVLKKNKPKNASSRFQLWRVINSRISCIRTAQERLDK